MDIGLDFVLNFKIIWYNVVRIYCKLIDLFMYYYVNLLYPVTFCCKLLYFEKWNAEINQTETETEKEKNTNIRNLLRINMNKMNIK